MVEEIWKVVPGFEGFYEASNLGQIRSIARSVPCCYGATRQIKSRVLKGSEDQDGYRIVTVSGQNIAAKSAKVHQLVMLAFVGPVPKGLQVLHANGIPQDCKLENLSYGTGTENWQDRKRHGRGTNGENNPNAKLTQAQINELCSLAGTDTYAAIGRKFGISGEHTSKLIKRKQNVSVN